MKDIMVGPMRTPNVQSWLSNIKQDGSFKPLLLVNHKANFIFVPGGYNINRMCCVKTTVIPVITACCSNENTKKRNNISETLKHHHS